MQEITTTIRTFVRFSEVDALKMVWHGNYVRYMEDAREAFGIEHGLAYMDIFHNGYFAPVVDIHLQYKHSATVNDVLLTTIKYHHCRGGKLMFDYRMVRESDNVEILTATSIQLFTTIEGELEVSCPEFLQQWRLKQGLI